MRIGTGEINTKEEKVMKRIIVLLIAAAMLAMGLGACAEATLTVQGVGAVNVDADRATVCLGVREIAEEVIAAQAAVNSRIESVVSALEAIGIGKDNINTNGIGIYPNYDYSDYERITGYSASNSLNITVTDVERVGEVIDAAFAAGANSLDYVDFTATDTAEASDRALALAVESAMAKARVLAKASGVTLGQIIEIRDASDYSYDYNAPYARTEETKDMGAGTLVMASGQKVTACVSITFAIVGGDEIG